MRLSCPVCSNKAALWQHLHDDRYAYPGAFPLLKCLSCGHAFLGAMFSPQQLSELYSIYYPRSTFDLERYQPYQEVTGLAAWLDGEKSAVFRWVPRNVRILDIGCGFGESLGYHHSRGCDAYGVEADENIRRVADKYGYKVHVGLFDPNAYIASFFDYVTMNQVIEHVRDPLYTLRGVARVLKPGGVAVLSSPNIRGWGARLFGKRWINWHAPYHLQFFTLRSMRQSAEKAGLTVEKTMTLTPSAWLHFQWLHLLTRPVPGTPSVFWTGRGEFSLAQKLVIKALSILHHMKINHMITRLFDWLGIGDNRLYFLRKR